MDREKALAAVGSRKAPWDLVVIGGGATGVGCALDAVSRGLEVLLLEQADFGKGTSGRSTKLIHGGVRYLAQGNTALVREALAERTILQRNAPEFVKIQPFIVPSYGRLSRFYYGAGLKMYDRLAGRNPFGRVKALGPVETLESVPGLKGEGLRGGVRYYDGRFDDARFLIALAAEACERGATLLNYARVEELRPIDGGSAVRFRDDESSDELEMTATAVIRAAGIFTSESGVGGTNAVTSKIAFSQGIHIVIDRSFLGSEEALMIPRTSDGRLLFAIPWKGRTLVGTTDTPVAAAELEPTALDREIDFLLETCASFFERRPVRSDILSVFAGIRPLVASTGGKATSKLSREHLVEVSRDAVVTVTGGKWTTYRKMAEDAVDAAIAASGMAARPSATTDIRIADKRGKGAAELSAGDSRLAEPMSRGFDYTWADTLYGIRSEMARTIDDVLSRRTRILYTDAREAMRLAPPTAEMLAKELGWTEEERKRELSDFLDLASRYLPEGEE